MPFDGVLFEFDGVLAETAPARREALLRALADEGLSLTGDEARELDVHRVPGDVAREIARARGTTLDEVAVDLVGLRASRLFHERAAHGLSLAPGVADLIGELMGRVRLGIVTKARRREVEMILSLGELEHAFDFVVTADDSTTATRTSEGHLLILERLGRRQPVQAARVIALESSPAGIAAATAAGMTCIAVGSLPVHQAMEASSLVPSLAGVTLASLIQMAAAARPTVQ